MEETTMGIDQVDSAGSTTELLAFAGYNEFEEAADRTAFKIKEGFMEMGNILKIARDTDILTGSGYANVEEFAQRRYDLDKGTVSRYIRIVERFSVGGNSHILKENYKKMGFAKLSLMLHMPDAIAEELMESLSKSEVLAIKEELDAESVISDIELAIEKAEEQETQEQTPQIPVPPEDASMLQKAVYQFGKEHPEVYEKVWQAVTDADFSLIPDILAPQGDAVLMTRIPGTGRIMIAVQGDSVSVTNVRTQEKNKHSMMELSKEFTALCQGVEETWESAYQSMYGILPEKEAEPVKSEKTEVAPVQPPKEKRKESKVTKAKPAKKEQPKEELPTEEPPKEEPLAAVVETQVATMEPQAAAVEPRDSENAEKEQIPGQDNILNHTEYLPPQLVDGKGGEDADNADNAATGASGDINDEPDGTGGDGTVEQPGDVEGMDREPEGVPEQERDAGEGESENQPHSVNTECEANFTMTDEEWEFIWEDIVRNATALKAFVLIYSTEDVARNIITKEKLEEYYQSAINVAVGLEKMINGKKYPT